MNNTMTEPTDIERVVMRRVHTIRYLRPLTSGAVLAALVLVAALWGIGREVWVAHVLQNAPKDVAGEAQYFVYAFDHTRIIVQALVVLTFASLVYLARSTARSITHIVSPAHA